MLPPPVPAPGAGLRADPDEVERQRSVVRYGLAGPAAWKNHDRGLYSLAARAAAATGCDDAAVTIFDDELQWTLAARQGPTVQVYPRALSLCDLLVARRTGDDDIVEVRDTAQDEQLADNPWVQGPCEQIGFYAAIAVVGREGKVLGTLCCWSRAPGELDEPARTGLRAVRDAVVRELDARRDGLPAGPAVHGAPLRSRGSGRELQDIIDTGAVRTHFQPIVHLPSGEVAAFEALTRGPATGDGTDPSALFAQAHAQGLLAELDSACLAAALREIDRSTLPPQLTWFLNVEAVRFDGTTAVPVVPDGLRAVLEVTERGTARDCAAVLHARDRITSPSTGIALDDFGIAPIAAALLALLRPDVVKFAVPTLREMPAHELGPALRALQGYARHSGAVLVAEGIETESDEHLAVALGATYAQGYRYGRPGPLPTSLPVPHHPVPIRPRAAEPPTAGLFDTLARTAVPRTATRDQLQAALDGVAALAGGEPRDTVVLRRSGSTSTLCLGDEVVRFEHAVDPPRPFPAAADDVLLAVGTPFSHRVLVARRRPDDGYEFVVADEAGSFAAAARSFADHIRLDRV